MNNIFLQLAIILGLSSILGFITFRLKLPLLVAYLIGGLLIASTAIFDPRASEVLHFFPEIGIAFVLFLVGMELDFREIKSLGKPILLAGILQIFITTITGSSIAQLLGFGAIESWYLGVGLAFSSTILVVKLLIDKKDAGALYGKLAVGILLLEDLLAVLLLVFLTVSNSVFGLGLQQTFPLIALLLKAVLLFGLATLSSKYLLSGVFKAVSRQNELLFITALAWCFIYISFAILLGFSVVIGAFLAGVALASSPFHFQIQGKVKPLREFFVALFFVYLGTQVDFTEVDKIYPLMFIFTGYTLLIKPTIFLLILGIFGFRKHTMFQTSLSLTHISEFSLILLLVGFELGVVSRSALTTIALSAVLSMIVASIMITNSNRLYKRLGPVLGFFERKSKHFAGDWVNQNMEAHDVKGHVIVIGARKVGGEIVKLLKKEKIAQIVLDFNPHQVEALLAEKIPVVYGDMGDPEVLDGLNLNNARMVISTSASLDDNLLLLEELKSRHINIPVIVRAETPDDAQSLYKKGADFVIIPEILAGDFLVEKLKDHMEDGDFFKDRSRIELERLSKKTLAWE
ncbi:MAG: sodium/hydrogen exchanger [Microgenomates group bacterium Gr01-1014_7]|nr:MAG: sodium/hydrogen exchanger [Microgenomates group bacterium Gr01-1014_7]